MGYPMTYQRVIHRNGLSAGDYDSRTSDMGGEITIPVKADFRPGVDYEEVLKDLLRHQNENLERAKGGRQMLLGDLRRLELDALDERAHVQYIAQRLGADPDLVAAVIREFMSW